MREENGVCEAAGGDVEVWIAGDAICLKSRITDPTDMSDHEAEEFGNLLIHLVKQIRGESLKFIQDGKQFEVVGRHPMGKEIYELANEKISLWAEDQGAICLKIYTDPADLTVHEAEELGNLLIRLAKQRREGN